MRTLARSAGPALLLFGVVDDREHVVLLCEGGRTGVLARALLLALRPLAAVGLEAAHVRRVEGGSHLQWLVRSCVRQPLKHGIGIRPALWTGSCFLDLVGARLLDGYTLPLGEALPRFRLPTLFEHVGLSASPLDPIDDAQLGALGTHALVQAASAALAAPPCSGLTRTRPSILPQRWIKVHSGGHSYDQGQGVISVGQLVGRADRTDRLSAGRSRKHRLHLLDERRTSSTRKSAAEPGERPGHPCVAFILTWQDFYPSIAPP